MELSRYLLVVGVLLLLIEFHEAYIPAEAFEDPFSTGVGKKFENTKSKAQLTSFFSKKRLKALIRFFNPFKEKHYKHGSPKNYGSGCYLDIHDDMHKFSPLLLKPSGPLDEFRFYLPPPESDVVFIKADQKMLLACPGDTNRLIIDKEPQYYKEVTAICDSKQSVIIDGTSVDYKDIECEYTPESNVIMEGMCMDDRLPGHSIGFRLRRGFIRLILVCYYPDAHHIFYVKHHVMRGADNHQRITPRLTYFQKDKFYRGLQPPIDQAYSCERGQLPALRRKLGSAYLAGKYVNCSEHSGNHIVKGHLAAYTDFVYYAEQKATMYYVNVVPLWGFFNNGNWKRVEESIRKYAKDHDEDLMVYTGSFRETEFPDRRRKLQTFYLSRYRRRDALPVCDQMYKIVYNQNMTLGIVFVGISSITYPRVKNPMLCEDVCDETKSFFNGWDRKDYKKGFIYCCTLEGFLENRSSSLVFPGRELELML